MAKTKLTIHHEKAATNKLTISAHILASGKLVELLALLLSNKGALSLSTVDQCLRIDLCKGELPSTPKDDRIFLTEVCTQDWLMLGSPS